MRHETLRLTALDLHDHLREPSPINKSETVLSGTKAMVLGGWAMGCDMPNNPGHHTNSLARMKEKHGIYLTDSLIPLTAYVGAQPEYENEAELPGMIRLAGGTKLYGADTTDIQGRRDVRNFEPQVRILHNASKEKPIMVHASRDNVEDFIGLIAVDYDHHIHICHVNNPADVEVVRKYKKKGHKVSCGVCVDHLTMTNLDAETRGPFAHRLPPLVRQIDVEELKYQFAEGDIDCIETDHAPHSYEAKMEADRDGTLCAGVPGAQHSLPVMFYMAKVDSRKGNRKGLVTMERIEDAVDTQPRRIMGVRFSPQTYTTWEMEPYRIEREDSQVESGAGWTPFVGMMAIGKVVEARVGGAMIYRDGVFTGQRAAKVFKRRGDII